jgi:hypothetical protein
VAVRCAEVEVERGIGVELEGIGGTCIDQTLYGCCLTMDRRDLRAVLFNMIGNLKDRNT